MRRIFIALVRSYQVATSNFTPRCKYYPSCSNYAITAVGRYGLKGIAMATWRLVHCNPWSQGGVDYVDEHLDCADAVNAGSKSKKEDNEKELVGAN
jgi:putative membrane protein insertion efficiency factor